MAVTYHGIQIKGVYCLLNGFFFQNLPITIPTVSMKCKKTENPKSIRKKYSHTCIY